MRLIKRLLHQSEPRLWLGAMRDMLQRAQSYYGVMNAVMMLITVYTVREATIHKWLPWMDFFAFLAVIVVVVAIVMVLDYKLVYPSQIAFHQHEAWKHRSLVKRDLDSQAERMKGIEASLKRIEDKLNGR